MNRTERLCAAERCDRPVHTTELCHRCADGLRAALRRVGALAAELRTTVTRQDRIGAGTGGRRGAEQPLAVNLAASDAEHALRAALVGWVRVLMEAEPPTLHGPACAACLHLECARIRAQGWPADTLGAMATWLAERTARIQTHPAAAEIHDEITERLRGAWRAVDRPGERWYAGRCTACGTDLYARPGAAWVRCAPCGQEWEVGAVRASLLEQAEDYLGTASEVVRAVTALRGRVTAATLRTWVARGRLTAHRSADGQTRYRVGDVAGLVRQTEGRTEERV
ncbi:DUF1922 domain-containing protein [Allonocardiopsis opalescens]|uniref:YD repeat-containing protein n=1 Tax=Allonocardiopsis opalescens TaxID=1144618 RepID=A0A2T0PVN3_9ACTN|nr:DUF1922 domain-containing protein [Allonocardiopsis opalescens]PRX95589.1 YD repeat-containing protein [Allonocardiopsis opalescens]